MATNLSELPEGFILEDELPEGFELEKPKTIDLSPSGMTRRLASVTVAPYYANKKYIPLMQAYKELRQKQEAMPRNLVENALDLTASFALPATKAFQGANLASKIGNSALTGAYQGGLISGIESLRDKGDLSGLGGGVATGATIGGAFPIGGQALKNFSKPIGEASKWVASKLTSLNPKTIERAIKSDSIALDLSEEDAQNLLMNTTERVRNAYNNLLEQRANAVGEATKKLKGLENRVNANDLKTDIKDVFDQYQKDKINPARNMTGNLEQDLYDLVDDGTSKINASTVRGTTRANIDDLGYIDTHPLDENSLYIDYIRNNTRGTNNEIGGIGSKLVDDLVEKNPDKNIIWDSVDEGAETFKQNYLRNHPELANKIFSEDEYKTLVALAEDSGYNINEYLRLIESYKNAETRASNNVLYGAGDDIARSNQGIYNAESGLPAKEFGNLSSSSKIAPKAQRRIEDYENSISPLSLQGVKEQLGKMTNWSDEIAKKYKNPVLEQIYGKFENRLSNLSPELAGINKAYANLRDFQKNEGLRSLLRSGDSIDSASKTLRNYNSTVTKGNTGRNIKELEDVLVKNNYEPFLNTVDDINAAMDLNKRMETGLNFLGANNLLKGGTALGLKGIRALNKNQRLQNIYNNLGQEAPSWLAPLLMTPMLQGSASYNEYR